MQPRHHYRVNTDRPRHHDRRTEGTRTPSGLHRTPPGPHEILLKLFIIIVNRARRFYRATRNGQRQTGNAQPLTDRKRGRPQDRPRHQETGTGTDRDRKPENYFLMIKWKDQDRRHQETGTGRPQDGQNRTQKDRRGQRQKTGRTDRATADAWKMKII